MSSTNVVEQTFASRTLATNGDDSSVNDATEETRSEFAEDAKLCRSIIINLVIRKTSADTDNRRQPGAAVKDNATFGFKRFRKVR